MTNVKKKILLIEDDHNLGYVILDNLSLNGYDVTWVKDGEEGHYSFLQNAFELCILDVMLPKKDGFTLAKSIRSKDPAIPILFLTAKSMTEDKLEGFQSGGDDYITKPFSLEELICRIEVFLRRTVNSPSEKKTYQLGAYLFDINRLSLIHPSGVKSLTSKETEVLKLLCKHKGQVVKREDILKEVWGDDDYFMGRSLDVYISKLRKYLRDDDTVKITNYHGVGFQLQVEQAKDSTTQG